MRPRSQTPVFFSRDGPMGFAIGNGPMGNVQSCAARRSCCRQAHRHRHANPKTQKYTDTQTHRHADTQTRRHADTQTVFHQGMAAPAAMVALVAEAAQAAEAALALAGLALPELALLTTPASHSGALTVGPYVCPYVTLHCAAEPAV